jgi:hypothetical protein
MIHLNKNILTLYSAEKKAKQTKNAEQLFTYYGVKVIFRKNNLFVSWEETHVSLS